MLESMTSLQFAEWIAYYSLEPFGEARADWRQAITSCILANSNRGKDSKASSIADFMLDTDEPEPQAEPEQKNIFELINQAAKAKGI